MDNKTKILKYNNSFEEVVDLCRSTVSKPPLGKEPSEQFIKSILISEHSPIRTLNVKWEWEEIKSWVATHWSRHKWECYIATQRSDRTGVNRDESPQGTLVKFTGEANMQQLIDTARKRLCYCSSMETRELMEMLKMAIYDVVSEDMANVLVPNCIYRGGCPELGNCKYFDNFTNNNGVFTDIQERYDAYNKEFVRKRK